MSVFKTDTVSAMRAAIELQHQAPQDLTGQQREYMLPRIRLVMLFMLTNFPLQFEEAMSGAVDGWGDKIESE